MCPKTTVPARRRKTLETGRVANWLIALTIALFGATTAAAITTASSRDCAPAPRLWQQNPPSILMKLPGAAGFDELLF